MKKLIVLFIVMCSFIPLSWAMDGCNQHLSPDEFRAKQKAYITEKAGLTKEEAAKFFPVYFELQDRKKQLNDEASYTPSKISLYCASVVFSSLPFRSKFHASSFSCFLRSCNSK